MAKSVNKTHVNEASVEDFLKQIEPAQKRNDSLLIVDMMQSITKQPPKMWGDSIIGFGQYHYKYASGREGDWFVTGFSPRKQNLTLYIMSGFDKNAELIKQLGKCKTSKACLYINKLADIDQKVLKKIIKQSAAQVEKHQSGC